MTAIEHSDIAVPQTTHEYETALADLKIDADKLIVLWGTGLSQNGKPEVKLDWYYHHNPEGTPLVVLLHHSKTQVAVGVAAIGPRRMRFGEVTLKGGALVDFVLQPEHRTFFPAMFLQKETRLHAVDKFDILFGFPNSRAVPIVRRVGYRCVGQFVRRTRVLRSSTYLAKYIPDRLSRIAGGVIDGCRLAALAVRGFTNPDFPSQWQDCPNDAFNELWQRVATSRVVMGVRDVEFLTWRFVNVPSKSFKFFTLTSSTNQQLVAYAVCLAHGPVLHVHDFLVDPNVPSADTRLWMNLSREAIRMGYSSLSLEFLGSDQQQRQLDSAGLLVRGRRPVYASVTKSFGSSSTWPSDVSPWYMTAADDDW